MSSSFAIAIVGVVVVLAILAVIILTCFQRKNQKSIDNDNIINSNNNCIVNPNGQCKSLYNIVNNFIRKILLESIFFSNTPRMAR